MHNHIFFERESIGNYFVNFLFLTSCNEHTLPFLDSLEDLCIHVIDDLDNSELTAIPS